MDQKPRQAVWQIHVSMMFAMLCCWSCAGTPGPAEVVEGKELAFMGAKSLHDAIKLGIERGFEVLPDCPHGDTLEAYIGCRLEMGYSVIVVGSGSGTKSQLVNDNLVLWVPDRSNIESHAAELVRGRHRPVIVLDFDLYSYSPEKGEGHVFTTIGVQGEDDTLGSLQWCPFFFDFLLCAGAEGRMRLALDKISTP